MPGAWSRSLSLRLLGIFTATALLLLIILIVQFLQGQEMLFKRILAPHMTQYIAYIHQDLGQPPSPERARRITERLPLAIEVQHDGRRLFSTAPKPTTDPESRQYRPLPAPVMRHLREFGIEHAELSGREGDRRVAIRTHSAGYTVTYDFGHRRRAPGARRHRDNDALWWSVLALALVLGGSYALIRRQLSPIARIQHGVARMSDGDLNTRIPVRGRSDLDSLAQSVNDMAERIHAMLDAKRQLLLSISHELRSPLTRARLATEMLPESRNRQRLQADIAEMESMITAIIESERLHQKHAVLNLETVDLVELAQSELDNLQIATTALQAPAHCRLSADPVRLRILIRNLLNNAEQHGQDEHRAPSVHVRIDCTAHTAHLIVEDRGPGIDESQRRALSEPFYRPDQSRTRATGGFGLGLSLARLIAEAHGGSLDIRNNPGPTPGAQVEVVLPVRAHGEGR